jgi:hypothetical protein
MGSSASGLASRCLRFELVFLVVGMLNRVEYLKVLESRFFA